MWTALRICSHCVVVAHDLSNFVRWFIANSKQLNITKMATSCVGPTVGKKPSQTRYSQRKNKPSVLARTTNPSFSLTSDVPAGSPVSSLPSIDMPNNAGIPNNCHFSYPFGPGPDPWWIEYPFLPWRPDLRFSSINNYCGNYNASPGTNSPMFSSCNSASVNYNNPTVLASSSSSPLFWVFKLNKRIATCYGCRNKFTRSADGDLPIPPLDLILKCNEFRQYYDKAGSLKKKDDSNAYYHPDINCIKIKHPDFSAVIFI